MCIIYTVYVCVCVIMCVYVFGCMHKYIYIYMFVCVYVYAEYIIYNSKQVEKLLVIICCIAMAIAHQISRRKNNNFMSKFKLPCNFFSQSY